MKKKIVPILLVLVFLFVILMVADSGFREKVGDIVGYVSSWLGVDWGPIKRWRTAELLYHLSILFA
jgi:hypothetical protein